MLAANFCRDQRGAVIVEVTIVMTFMFVLVLGGIEFLLLFYQWNAAAKAVQIGARLAAVSDPVAGGLNGLSAAVVSTGKSFAQYMHLSRFGGFVLPHASHATIAMLLYTTIWM